MKKLGDGWMDLIVLLMIAVLIAFAVVMVLAIIALYWYGIPSV